MKYAKHPLLTNAIINLDNISPDNIEIVTSFLALHKGLKVRVYSISLKNMSQINKDQVL